MAYMNQQKKQQIAPVVKKILAKYGVKGSLAVHNHMTLVLNIKSGSIDFIKNYNETVSERAGGFRLDSPAVESISVNPYWYHEHFSGVAKFFLTEIMVAMNAGNHDNSDVQSDYFDIGWYIDINLGRWDKPYLFVE